MNTSDHLIHGIPQAPWQALLAVLARHPKVRSVVLFGSRAKGNYRPGSDIDLCLHADELTLSEKLSLDLEIDDLLLPWKVDLVVWQSIDDPALKAHIERFGVLVPLPSPPAALESAGSRTPE